MEPSAKRKKLEVEPSAQEERMRALNQVVTIGRAGLKNHAVLDIGRKLLVEKNC